MNIDVQSLDTFNQLAHEGAQAATEAMTQMTGIKATVEDTRISLIDRADLGEELGDDTEYVGVEFDFEGPLRGNTVLVFKRQQSDAIVEALLGDDTDHAMAQSSVEEIGNMMMSGFIDGWADYLDATIEHSPPSYIECEGGEVMTTPSMDETQDQVFVFRSEVNWNPEEMCFYIYMVPEYTPMAQLLAEHATTEDDAIPIEKLTAFNEMSRQGAENAASNVEMLTGFETRAEISQISFAPIEDVPKQFEDQMYVGTAVEFTGMPSGYLLVLFDETSAATVADALLSIEPEGGALTDQQKSAIEELGNIITSGFVDGWANVLQQSIDHTPPRLVHDMGQAIVDPLVAQLGQQQQHAFIIDSKMVTEEVAFESEIHALPNERQLREALDELNLDRTDETAADPDQLF
jgi:chemotaxis protein CheC